MNFDLQLLSLLSAINEKHDVTKLKEVMIYLTLPDITYFARFLYRFVTVTK